jgi:hypothetical protein
MVSSNRRMIIQRSCASITPLIKRRRQTLVSNQMVGSQAAKIRLRALDPIEISALCVPLARRLLAGRWLPEFDLVAFGIHDPAELPVL